MSLFKTRRSVLAIFSLVLATVGCGAAVQAEDGYKAGEHYTIIEPAARFSPNSGKIEVVEVFWYGCPHCFSFEPAVKAWAANLPEDVEFIRLPAAMNRSWAVHARAFYTAEALGMWDTIHPALFNALNVEEQKIFTPDQVKTFFEKHGANGDKFDSAWNSFSVDSQVRRAEQIVKAWGPNSVPTMAVNGKYWTSASMAGSHGEEFKIIEALIERERQAQ